MEIIAVTNIKGGVGKTTTAVNLAYLSAVSGIRTVLWDLDPQAAASYILRGAIRQQTSAKKLVRGSQQLGELLYLTDYPNLHLIAADRSFRNLDVHMSQRKKPTERLMKMSRSLRELCDRLFLDCPPGMSLLSENVLRAADAVVVPIVPTPLSLRTLEQLHDFVDREGWSDLRILPFFSMVDRRKSLHEQIIAAARERFPGMLTSEIPYWSTIERMAVRRAPIPAYAPASPATDVYRSLWQEITRRLA
jgi:cellulose biosynthesis protein BcsQ